MLNNSKNRNLLILPLQDPGDKILTAQSQHLVSSIQNFLGNTISWFRKVTSARNSEYQTDCFGWKVLCHKAVKISKFQLVPYVPNKRQILCQKGKIFPLKCVKQPRMMVHTYNLSTQETEIGGCLQVGGQPGLHNEFINLD